MPPTTYTNAGLSFGGNPSAWPLSFHANVSFPSKLYRVLQFAEQRGLSNVVSWRPHGRAFKIHDPDHFMNQVARRFFMATKMRSIHRQLNLWGFQRITKGEDRDSWFHESFLRGRPELMKKMRRTRIKGKIRKPPLESIPSTPNFYQMPPIEAGTNSSSFDGGIEYTRQEKPSVQPRCLSPLSQELASLPRYFVNSHQAAPELCDHYHRVSCSDLNTDPTSQMLEPLPFGGNNDMLPFKDEEFLMFVCSVCVLIG